MRTADPYGDTDVIDARAPRFNQAVIGSLALLAVVLGRVAGRCLRCSRCNWRWA